MQSLGGGSMAIPGRTRVLSLDRDEIMVLTDRTLNTDAGTDEKPVRSYDLLLKLGSAYLEAMTLDGIKGPEVPIALTESEAWLLRAKVTSSDKTQSDALFGVKLLKKLYEVLLRFNDGLDALPVTEMVGEEMTLERKQTLREWQAKTEGDHE